MSDNDRQRREVHFFGRVQGVGFRYTVRQIAAGFPVVGYVRNLYDGRVELVTEGPADVIDGLIGEINNHFQGNIARTEQQTRPPKDEFNSFQIRH